VLTKEEFHRLLQGLVSSIFDHEQQTQRMSPWKLDLEREQGALAALFLQEATQAYVRFVAAIWSRTR
jgi:hypothetical protein